MAEPRGRRWAAAGAVVATATAVAWAPAGIATAGGESGGDEGVGFTVGITQDIDSLNPFTGITVSAYEMYALVYDTLTGYAQEDFSPVPGLAESWEASDDGLTWTYSLREGVTFSDGEPLTAADVEYTFSRVIDGDYEQTNYGNYVANIETVEATDDRTVVMTLSTPTPIMEALAVPILPAHVWEEIDGTAVADFTNEPDEDGGAIGSGPFRLVEHVPNQFLRFEANPDHWAGAPDLDTVTFRVFSNQDSLAQALRRGEIDFADGLDANVYTSLEGVDGITTVAADYSGFNELAMNTGAALDDGTPIGDGHPALTDVAVRRAIAHAVDTETLVRRSLGGYGTPGSSVIPPLYEQLHLDPGPDAYGFDLEEAERLLDEAGYPRGDEGVRAGPDGEPLDFRLMARQESPASQTSAQFIAGWLGEIGIATEVSTVSEDALTEIIGQGEFDLFEWGWVVEPDPNYQLSTFTCASRSYVLDGTTYANLSDSFYCNPAYDELFEAQATEVDRDARAELVRQMQQLLYEDVPYVVTYYYDNLEAYRSDRFTGFAAQPDPDGSLLFQYGTYSYRAIRPVAGSADDGGGLGTGTVVGIVAGVVVLGAGGLLLVRSRRRPADETE